VKKNLIFVLLACAAVFVFSNAAMAQRLPNCNEPGSIMRVTKSRAGKFEYVTFELKANDPNYNIENGKPPFYDYSGEKRLYIKGKAFKEITFQGIAWQCKIRENFGAVTSTVQGVRNTEQFEGVVTYVIGYSAKSKYVGVTASGVGSTKVTLKFKR
jgi:hypothetical protein